MFSLNHFIWLAISAAVIILSLIIIEKFKISLKTVLTIACIVCVLSEVTKVFSVMHLVPSIDGTRLYPYMKMQHLPFHLCSIQIFLIFYARFSEGKKNLDTLYGFMYPTAIFGAIAALAMPSIFDSGSVKVAEAFIKPHAYQYFLFHTMLIILGIHLFRTKYRELKPRHCFSTMGILGALGLVSIYLNSIFAVPTYENHKLTAVDYTTNLFFTYRTPIGIKLTELWHWYLYLGIIAALAVVLIIVSYIPVFINSKKSRNKPDNQIN